MSCERGPIARRILRFGAFELDVPGRQLRKHGMKIRLGGQPLQILVLLLERPGDVVTRDEVRQKLWSADTSVDFDVGLSSAVRKLRDALRDSAENPRFIETLPRLGYRFIAPVLSSETEPLLELLPSKVSARVNPQWVAGALAIALIVAFVAVVQWGAWRRLTGPVAAAPIRSIAVLPFENLTGDASKEYFVDEMTDRLTTNLAHLEGLRVVSPRSTMHYKRARKPLPVICKELTVDAIVEGSVARLGEHLQISAQLIRKTDQHVWARNYEGELRDAAALQTEIARGIADAIRAANRPER